MLRDYIRERRESLADWSTEILLTAVLMMVLADIADCERRAMAGLVQHG